MNSRCTVMLSMLVGMAIGAVAIQGLHAQAKPPVYFVTENDVSDAATYGKEFQPIAQKTIKAHGGKYLAAGTATAMSGDPPKSRVAIMVWDSAEQLQKWFNDPEYQEARKNAEKYTKFRNFSIGGVAQ